MGQPAPVEANRRLDSWKEIAAFFGRDERTVRRWEKESSLPVHRVPGGAKGRVFAYESELGQWLRTPQAVASEMTEPAEPNPPGESAERRSASVQPKPLKSGAFSRMAAWIVPLLFVGGLAIYFAFSRDGLHFRALADHHPSNVESQAFAGPDSVAVLPFTNDHGDADTDYLSDGITESLMASLAHLPHLKVRSRDSVFRFKGQDLDIQTVGKNLGVSGVVSGRVTVHGDTVEISSELTDVRDNSEIWGHRYIGKRTDLISLQQQMAGDLAGKLRSTLSTAGRERVTNQGTQDPEAYALYLKGRYAWNKRTLADIETAISYFNQAIDKDPEYALAYAGLADAYSVRSNFGGSPSEAFPKSNAAARKALELDPALARPHAVLGMNEFEYDWDFSGAELELKKAIEIDPNDATAHQWYAEKLSQLGRNQEAMAEINRAHELDPLSPVISRVIGAILTNGKEYDQAISVCQQLARENPTFAIAHDCLVYAYWGKHMYADVVEQWTIEGQLTRNPDDIVFASAFERGFRSAGWNGAMAAGAGIFEARRKRGYGSPFFIARFYSDMGNKEKAFEWLDIAFREHDRLLPDLNISPGFDAIRSDPRFAELASRIGFGK